MADSTPAGTAEREPTVVVDHLEIVYRVHQAGTSKGNAPSIASRLLRGVRSPAMREIHAVRGVTFTAYRGESIGLIGRNGSGKSTLLRAIAGLLPPVRGAVYTQGQPSLLSVNAALMDGLTGERNIRLGCLAMGMTADEVDAKYQDIVDFAGIDDFISLPMNTYSAGMAARLRFAIAAAKSHNVLMIDEALGTGDAEFKRKSEKRIQELREEAGTVFLVSHALEVVRESCNRAIWLDKGLVVMDGDVHEVLDAYEAATG